MRNTGEQFIPGVSSKRLAEEHLARYEFAEKYCQDKIVLDVACGTGYGSYQLSQVSKSVMGVDYSNQVIKFAKENYQADNLSFIQADCTQMDFEKNKFDVIVSFETIEHLETGQRQKFLSLINKFLKNDGYFILSTPNKKVTSPYTPKPLNPHHVVEFTKKMLAAEINQFFIIKKWLGQRYVENLLLIKIVRKFVRLIEILLNKDFGIYATRSTAQVTASPKKNMQPRLWVILAQKRYV